MRVEVLDAKIHQREHFDCGIAVLNTFLQRQANQQAQKDQARTYVLVNENAPTQIIGFYTLALTKMDLSSLTLSFQKHYQHTDSVGLIARLAVDRAFQGQGYGGKLLYDALMKLYQASEIVGFPVIFVDAKVGMASFYEAYGFQQVNENNARLYLAVETFRKALS